MTQYFIMSSSLSNQVTQFINVIKEGNLLDIQNYYNDNPDIEKYTNCSNAFCNACVNGHLEVAKWLLKVKPNINISIKNDDAFKSTCKNNFVQIAKWFTILDLKYFVVINNNKIVKYNIRYVPFDKNIKLHLHLIDESEHTCPICYENIINIQTNCKHNFCKSCIITHYENNKNCPYCRTSLTTFYSIV